MIGYSVATKSGYGFDCLPPGMVVIQIAMNSGVLFQFHETLFQITDRVHHEKVGRTVDANIIVSFSMKFLVRQEVHKALEHADMVWDYILVVPDDRYVFSLYTSLVIRIAYLVTTGPVFKGYAEIVSFA